MPEVYLNYDAASVVTDLSKPTLKKKVSAREIPFLKIGRRVVFRRSDLDRWMSQHAVRELA
jgi:excisionase family DNA binding protein